MKYLLDTHFLLWAAIEPNKLSLAARQLIENKDHELFFSAASIWEIVIKNNLKQEDFYVDPQIFRRALLDNGYTELPISSIHATEVNQLPLLHKDPFDRILIAQAIVEGIFLLTMDRLILQYKGPIQAL